MRNLMEMGAHTKRSSSKDSDGDGADNWWMENLFRRTSRVSSSTTMAQISCRCSSNPTWQRRDDASRRPRVHAAGTLVALSEVNGNKQAAQLLGVAAEAGGIPEDAQVDDATVNMDFAKDWIQKIFETPRGERNIEEIEAGKSDAFNWLKENFGRKEQDEENCPPVEPIH